MCFWGGGCLCCSPQQCLSQRCYVCIEAQRSAIMSLFFFFQHLNLLQHCPLEGTSSDRVNILFHIYINYISITLYSVLLPYSEEDAPVKSSCLLPVRRWIESSVLNASRFFCWISHLEKHLCFEPLWQTELWILRLQILGRR